MDPTTFRMMSGATAPPVEISFQASNYYPAGNTSTTLSWTVTNATSIHISDVGFVGQTGAIPVSGNNVTRTYTLTAIGFNGLTYTQSLTITWSSALTCIDPTTHPGSFPWYCPWRPSWAECQPICS